MSDRRFTRRGVLTAAGAAGVGMGLGGYVIGRDSEAAIEPSGATHDFHGPHQAGITTPAQDRLHFASFDLTTSRVADLRALLREWSAAAALMMAGRPVGDVAGEQLAPPDDTGEAEGLTPARLTITFGFGPSLFERLGLESKRPRALRDLPAFAGDRLDPSSCGGDLAVQACADDPQVAFHAVRNLARIARGLAVLRWTQLGFGRTSSTSRAQDTPRNLMGFKDGTNNIKGEDRERLARDVWVASNDGPGWMEGGSYMVTRRIRMLIEVWDRSPLADQEATIGRHKLSGAPLGAEREFDEVKAQRLPSDSHVRIALPEANGDRAILRRGYSFTDGADPQLGQLDAGLFFISFQRTPAQFIELQRRLGQQDKLNEYIEHTGSAIFAVPPGTQRRGGYVGETLLG